MKKRGRTDWPEGPWQYLDEPVLSGPDYESPNEERIGERLDVFLRQDLLTSAKQYPIRTQFGTFRLDFFVEGVGIECDSLLYHRDPERDRWRDAVILAEGKDTSGGVRVIYRLSGPSIHYNPNATLFVLSRYEPEIFSGGARTFLEEAAHPRLQEQVRSKELGDEFIAEIAPMASVRISRRHLGNSDINNRASIARMVQSRSLINSLDELIIRAPRISRTLG